MALAIAEYAGVFYPRTRDIIITLKAIVGATHSRDKWLQFATMRRSYS
jgi:hypothetical protein